MALTIRPADRTDLDKLVPLLLADAQARCAANPGLWRMDPAAQDKTQAALAAAMAAEKPVVRQSWLLAEADGVPVGVSHSILLPVPPIYAGEFGPPGLIMEDCYVAPDAPDDTRRALLNAAETDLIAAGASILLASNIDGGSWEHTFAAQGFAPLTKYFAKTGLTEQTASAHVRPANAGDVPDIVASSAIHRQVLDRLHHLFWKPHAEADARFGAWMQRSLTLEDRDMFVAEQAGRLRGYAISQPATPTHFPTPHDISGVGVIDDFFHDVLEDTGSLNTDAPAAGALFAAAEAARGRRGNHSVLVVCPADWQSKIDLLEQQGYRNAITWHIKMQNV